MCPKTIYNISIKQLLSIEETSKRLLLEGQRREGIEKP